MAIPGAINAALRRAASNTAELVIAGADTTVPVISGITETDLTSSGVTIGWTTNESADSQVRYGTVSGVYTLESDLADTPPNGVTTHSVVIAGLAEDTLYYYVILSRDASTNLATSTEGTFTTTDATAPIISAEAGSESKRATGVSGSQVLLTCNTNESCDTKVQYGTVVSGAFASETAVTNGHPSGVTSHSATITGLIAETAYQFRFVCRDATLNSTTSATILVTTIWTPVVAATDLVSWGEPDLETGIADATEVAIIVDHSAAHTGAIVQNTVGAKPVYHIGNGSFANGKTCLHFDGTADRLTTTADIADFDMTGDFTLAIGFTHTAAALDTLAAKAQVASNTRAWDVGVAASGALYIFTDGKGSNQASTATNFGTDGLNHLAVWRRAGGTDSVTVSYDGTIDANTFTGMTTTASDGNLRIGSLLSGGNLFDGDIFFWAFWKNDISDAVLTKLFAYIMPRYVTVPDLTAPTITETMVVEATIQTALAGGTAAVSWTTSESANGRVEWSTASDFTGSTLTSVIADASTAHSHTVTGLPADTTIYFRAISADASANSTTGSGDQVVSLTTSLSLHQITPVFWLDSTLQIQADATTTQTVTNYGSGTISFTNGTANQRPTYRTGSMSGASCWELDITNDQWTAADTADLDLSATDAWWGAVFATTTTTDGVLFGRYSADNTERWAIRINGTTGKLGMFMDGKGSEQLSTYADFNDGQVYAVLIVLSGTTATLYVNGTAHDVWTGMSITNADGAGKIGAQSNGGDKLEAQIALLACDNAALDAGQRAIFDQYVS